MVFSAAALTMLSGTIDSSMSRPLGASALLLTIACARSLPWLSNCCASAGSTPAPGSKKFTSTMPITTATAETTTV